MNTDELLNIYKKIYEQETKNNFDYCKCDLSKIDNLKYKINNELDLKFQPEEADEIILYRIKKIKNMYKNVIEEMIKIFIPILFSFFIAMFSDVCTLWIQEEIAFCIKIVLLILTIISFLYSLKFIYDDLKKTKTLQRNRTK